MATLYVGNLARDTRERDIEDLFRGVGRIKDISFKRGYCFVDMEDRRDGEDAVKELNGKRVCGQRVSVESSRGRGSGPGYRGVNERRDHDDRRDSRRSRSPYRGGGGRGGGGGGGNRPERTKYSLLLANLSTRVTWSHLKDVGRKYGPVTFADAHKKVDREGVMTFSCKSDMKAAFDGLQGHDLYDRPMEVAYEFPEVARDEWKGDVNNDHPDFYNKRSRSRSRGRRDSRSPRRRDSRDRSRSPPRRRDSRDRSPPRRDSRDRSAPRRRSYSRSRSR